MLGLIGWSHFPANAQAEESEERRWPDWDRGETIFTSSAKSKVAESGGQRVARQEEELYSSSRNQLEWLFSISKV